MKIQVVKKSGGTETLNIPFPVELNERGETFNVIQGADGMDHYFYKDTGLYDGWGRALPGIPELDAVKLIENVEASRDIHPEKAPKPSEN